MIVAYFLGILVFSLILVWSANRLVIVLRRLANLTGLGTFTISAVILALAVDFPELSLGVTAALENEPNLSLGNVLGASIAVLALVAGSAALVAGQVSVHGLVVQRDVRIAFLAGLAPLFLLWDKTLSRIDGLILLSLYGAYAFSLFRERFVQIAQEGNKEGVWQRFLQRIQDQEGGLAKEVGHFFLGVALLLFSANILVRLSKGLALELGVPIFLVGLIFLAVGTTLPELVFSFTALLKRESSMFFGNLLGSIITKGTLIIGLVSLISPITIMAFREYFLAVATFLITFALFWFFIRTKHRLDRWEAALLLSVYILFVLLELYSSF